MNELKKEVKQLAAGGALDVIARVLKSMAAREENPSFDGNPNTLVYETGKLEGKKEIYVSLMDNLNELAK